MKLGPRPRPGVTNSEATCWADSLLVSDALPFPRVAKGDLNGVDGSGLIESIEGCQCHFKVEMN